MRSVTIVALGVIVGVTLQGCRDPRAPTELAGGAVLTASVTWPDQPGGYIIVFTAERVPADFRERAARLGGLVEASLDSIGVAAVTGLSEGAASELAGAADVRAVEPDMFTAPPNEDVGAEGAVADEAVSETLAPADATASPTTALFYARQWNLRAGFAPEALAAGHLGVPFNDGADLDHNVDLVQLPVEAANA